MQGKLQVANVSVGTYKGVVDFGSGVVNGGDMTVTVRPSSVAKEQFQTYST